MAEIIIMIIRVHNAIHFERHESIVIRTYAIIRQYYDLLYNIFILFYYLSIQFKIHRSNILSQTTTTRNPAKSHHVKDDVINVSRQGLTRFKVLLPLRHIRSNKEKKEDVVCEFDWIAFMIKVKSQRNITHISRTQQDNV